MSSSLFYSIAFVVGVALLGALASPPSSKHSSRFQSIVNSLRPRFQQTIAATAVPEEDVRIFSRYDYDPTVEVQYIPRLTGYLNRKELEAEYNPETWQRQVYDDLIGILTLDERGGKTFPCVYAAKGWRGSEHRYVFAQSDDPSEPRNVRLIGSALRKYLKISHSCGPNTTLVVLCPPSPVVKSVEQYNLDFWAFLHGLRVFDTKPWPKEIPEDTTHNRWAFCFDGVPWFPAALTPAHVNRQSRYTPSLVYVMQPKWIFDILFSTPKKRFGACEKVRALVKEFDDVDISPDVAHYGEPGTTESRQYYLYDVNERSYCPYKDLI